MKKLALLSFLAALTVGAGNTALVKDSTTGTCSQYVKLTNARDADSEILQGIAHDTELAEWVDTLRGEISAASGNIDDTAWSGANWTETDTAPSQNAVQGALNTRAAASALTNHETDTGNPHETTKAQVGLGNVDNTSDADKPVSTATQNALNLKANSADTATDTELAAHTIRTDNPHAVTPAQVGADTAQWNASKIQGRAVSSGAPSDKQGLVWDASGAQWQPGAAGHVIQSAGTPMTARSNLNFSGDITVTDDADSDVTIIDFDLPATFATTFTSSDSDSCVWTSNTLRVTHSRGTTAPDVWIFDATDYAVSMPWNVYDANSVDIDFAPIGGKAAVSGTWSIVISGPNGGDYTGSGGTGDVTGPASSVDGNVALFDGVTGKAIKDSGLTLSGTNTGDETDTSIKTKIGAATSSNSGYLTSTDWETFNGKQGAATILTTLGNLSNSAGYLYNNGSGTLSYATPGGSGASVTQSDTFILEGYASTTITATAILAVYELDSASYDNPGGSGNKTPVIFGGANNGWTRSASTYRDLINGMTQVAVNNGAAVTSSMYASFDFGTQKVITETTFACSGTTNGYWKMQGSNDNSSWTDLSGSTEMTNGAKFDMSSNTTAYRFYKMVGVSGNINNDYWNGLTFKISYGPVLGAYVRAGNDSIAVTKSSKSGSQTFTIRRVRAGTRTYCVDYIQ